MHAPDATGFHLVSSNRLDWLAARLAERIAAPRDPLSLLPETVLIPQPTLRRWLQVELAQRLGIAANIEFLTPSEWVWRMLRAAHPGLPEHSPWEPDALRWRLFALLGEGKLPRAVADYLQRGPKDAAIPRWQLAERLADAFDKYQAYRRGLLERWEQGADADDWQAVLWRRLQDAANPPRSRLIGDWLRNHAQAAPPGLPPRLFAFGTIHVSPDVLRMLGMAARHCELHFHLPTPSAAYWGDVASLRAQLRNQPEEEVRRVLYEARHDNPLLQAWGEAAREFVAQLYSYELVQPASEDDDFADEPPRDTLLHAMQADVLERTAPRRLPRFDANDASLQVHVCHSKLREVEVLHDRLLGLLNDDETLKPSDIAVLAPDIGDYLPLVRAVFDGMPRSDARFIPFTLSDQPQAQAHPLVALFLQLLELPQSRRSASEVRDLLAVPALMTRFDLDDSDLEKLERWLAGAGIRWGDDEGMRERLGVGRWREHSFAFGIDRLLLGYAGGSDEMLDGIAPFPELEGSDAGKLDALLRVLKELRQLSDWMRTAHAASEWQARLNDALRTLLPEHGLGEEEKRALRVVQDALGGFARQAANAGELPIDVVAAALREALDAPSPHQPFLGGGVTFAGMVPLRTVPFRVICLLGMDADVFPRRDAGSDVNRIGADLRDGRRRLGDRSVRIDDRFLFLQLFSAAGDVFYLSCGGRDARDGSVREPSALVGELLDVAQRYLPDGTDAREVLCIEHPLQPFSAQAFGAGDPRRFSYRGEWHRQDFAAPASAAPAFFDANLPLPAWPQALSLPTLQRFLRNPARGFLRDMLGLQLPADANDDFDTEPLGANKLLENLRIRSLLAGAPGEESLRAKGLLPPGAGERVAFVQAEQIATPLLDAKHAWLGQSSSVVCEKTLDIDGCEVPLYLRSESVAADDGLRRAHMLAGSLKGKHLLDAWIEHLAWSSAWRTPVQTMLFFHSKEHVESLPLPQLGHAEARAHLRDLIELWRRGQAWPLPFAPDAAWEYAQVFRRKNGDADAAAKAAQDKFTADYGEGADAWQQLAYRPHGLFGDSKHVREFADNAQTVFAAIATAMPVASAKKAAKGHAE